MLHVLFLSDTHIGVDHPAKLRSARRPRGPDFVSAMRAALAPARAGAVDLVIHGGDLFNRSKPPPHVLQAAHELVFEVLDLGIPVVVTPGNHERSRLPAPLLWSHDLLHILTKPDFVSLERRGLHLVIGGFAFQREVPAILEGGAFWHRCGLDTPADLRLFCFHQAVAGATVGANNFTFRVDPQTYNHSALRLPVAAILSGHIHRHQVLEREGCPPVIYAGSTERTSFTERYEEKCALLMSFSEGPMGGVLSSFERVNTRARPMTQILLTSRSKEELQVQLLERLKELPRDAVVQIQAPRGAPASIRDAILSLPLRRIAPPSMSISFSGSVGSKAT